jgi:hypothetical protein
LRSRLALVKQGVPWAAVFGDTPWSGQMPESFVLACNVVLGELDGGEFDWHSMRWKERK